VIGQRDDAGAELDALGALAGRGEEHLGRGNGLPAGGMVLAAPEFVIAEFVELLDESEVAAELQHRMLADRMMRGEEGSELQARHGGFSGNLLLWAFQRPKVRAGGNQGNRAGASAAHGWRAMGAARKGKAMAKVRRLNATSRGSRAE